MESSRRVVSVRNGAVLAGLVRVNCTGHYVCGLLKMVITAAWRAKCTSPRRAKMKISPCASSFFFLLMYNDSFLAFYVDFLISFHPSRLRSRGKKKKERRVKSMLRLKRVIPGGEHLSAACRVLHSVPLVVWGFLSFFSPPLCFLVWQQMQGFIESNFKTVTFPLAETEGRDISQRESSSTNGNGGAAWRKC